MGANGSGRQESKLVEQQAKYVSAHRLDDYIEAGGLPMKLYSFQARDSQAAGASRL